MEQNNATRYVVRIKRPDVSVLMHHGILGQKWGQRNGPHYPLSYNQHSSAEKRLNSRSELTGDKKKDKRIIQDTYKEAKYAKAASLLAKSEGERARTKAMKRGMKVGKDSKYEIANKEGKMLETQSRKAEENSKYFSEKYQRQISEYLKAYGKENFKAFSQDKIDNMSVSKASNFIANNNISGFVVLAGAAGGAVKGYHNYKNYRNYVENL